MTIDSDVWELHTRSFVVRVWLEETATDTEPAVWRGHITDVTTGSRRYVQKLDEIADFIALYLSQMGVVF